MSPRDVLRANDERFVDAVAGLTPDEWAAPSLCSEWSNREVLAHLVVGCSHPVGAFLGALARHRNFDRANTAAAQGAARDRSTQALLNDFRAVSARPTGIGRYFPARLLLGDHITHELDILFAVGRESDIPSHLLNAVLGTIRSDPRRAETALEEMAELFRALMHDPRELVPLSDEIALCRKYLALERLRLGDERVQVKWDIESCPPDALMPPLMLQPLLHHRKVLGKSRDVGIAGFPAPPDAGVVRDRAVVAAVRAVLLELRAQAPQGLAESQPTHGDQHCGVPHDPDVAPEIAGRVVARALEEPVVGLAHVETPLQCLDPLGPARRGRNPGLQHTASRSVLAVLAVLVGHGQRFAQADPGAGVAA